MAEPNRRWWYALGVLIVLGNFVLAIVALLHADLFLFLVGICVGVFVAVPLYRMRSMEDNNESNRSRP